MKKCNILLFFGVLFSIPFTSNKNSSKYVNDYLLDDGSLSVPMDYINEISLDSIATDKIFYKPVDSNKNISDVLLKYGIISSNKLSNDSDWYIGYFGYDNPNIKSVVNNLRKSSLFDEIDYDYLMSVDTIDELEYLSNSYFYEQPYLKKIHALEAWEYMDENSGLAGGSPDTIVAVIDTGVDVDHDDLKNNLWCNAGEIPDNGIDDDNNGYIDDVNGWNFVANNNNPRDDHGHGTHVAGIIASENNNIGTIGVSYNSKIMCLKAGNASGFFTQSSIAEAITYAYMNGASVINMSFGSESISLSLQDTLKNANRYSILVAAAGNDHTANEDFGMLPPLPIFPASLSYVAGVMSISDHNTLSSFSNFDVYPFNGIEYEIYSYGENIISTLPGNQYGKLSGTSMATPIVSGVAALLKSQYSDLSTFSIKDMFARLCSTNIQPISNQYFIDNSHSVVDAFLALSSNPRPHVGLSNYYLFDNSELSNLNNANCIVEPGETISIGYEMNNHGGPAYFVESILSYSNLMNFDPYIEINDSDSIIDAIGTYATYGSQISYDDGGIPSCCNNGFTIKIADDCPNDYQIQLTINTHYYGDLERLGPQYSTTSSVLIIVSSGYILPSYINEDTTYSGDKKYILTGPLTIPYGKTVSFEAGAELQFFSTTQKNYSANNPEISVFGTLNFCGSVNNRCNISPSANYSDFRCTFSLSQYGVLNLSYTDSTNFYGFFTNAVACSFEFNPYITNQGNEIKTYLSYLENNVAKYSTHFYVHCKCNLIDSNVNFSNVYSGYSIVVEGLSKGNTFILGSTAFYSNSSGGASFYGSVENCIFAGVENEYAIGVKDIINIGTYISFIWNGTNGTSTTETRDGLFRTVSTIRSYTTEQKVSNCYFLAQDSDLCDSLLIFSMSYCFQSYFSESKLIYKLNELQNIWEVYKPYEDVLDSHTNSIIAFENNMFSNNLKDYVKTNTFINYLDDFGFAPIDIDNVINSNLSNKEELCPFIYSLDLFDEDDNLISTVGYGSTRVLINFSKDMDMSYDFNVHYGSNKPFNTSHAKGHFVNPRTWEGEILVESIVDNGINKFSFYGGKSTDGQKLFTTAGLYWFNIDASSALSMDLFTESTESGVKLNWMQNDYDVLMGYNIYRSESPDGPFVRINPFVVPAASTEYIDNDVEIGKTYYYYFRVVLTDFTETGESNIASGNSYDTIAPIISYNPVKIYNNNGLLTISCIVTDNIDVQIVKLYYRTSGSDNYSSTILKNSGNIFSGNIPSSVLVGETVEYYIEAFDGINYSYFGSADNPIACYSANSIEAMKGDVDGDGNITTKDALMIVMYLEGELDLTEEQFLRADLNNDGELSSAEALRILQYINNNVQNL